MSTALHIHRHGAWFRIRGWGLRLVSHNHCPPRFSERNGYGGPYWHLGPLCVKPLRPADDQPRQA